MTTDEAIQRRFRFRTRTLPWFPRRGDRNDLAALFGELGFTIGVEIGTHRGRFAATLCQANPKLRLTCIDPWSTYFDGGQVSQERQDTLHAEAVKMLQNLPVTIIRKMSMEAVGAFPDDGLDFAYIDGNHLFDYEILDIIFWTPKVRVGGVIAVHDYNPFVGIDVVAAVDAYTRSHDIDPWYVTREETPTAFWVKR